MVDYRVDNQAFVRFTPPQYFLKTLSNQFQINSNWVHFDNGLEGF
jgi:hypothetical protein